MRLSRNSYDVVTIQQFLDRYRVSPADVFAFQDRAGQLHLLTLAIARRKPPTPLF